MSSLDGNLDDDAVAMARRSAGARAKRKGAKAELDLVNWLRQSWPARWGHVRRYMAGDGRQPGDVDGVAGVTIEVKNRRSFNPNEWLKQARASRIHDSQVAVVVVKPVGIGDPAEWLFIMRAEDGFDLLHRLAGYESP